MIKGLVFDPSSFFSVLQCEIDDDWFEHYEIPTALHSVKRIPCGDLVFFLDIALNDETKPIIVIDLTEPYPIFRKDRVDRYVLDRLSTVGRAILTNSVSIPFNWHSHGQGSLQSVYAANKNIGGGSRIHFDSNPAGNKDLLFFSRVDAPIEFSKLHTADDVYLSARSLLNEAIKSPPPRRINPANVTGINLSRRLPESFSRGATLDQWYETKLTEEQREFVDKSYDGPVRLRGAAGTGKTLSLAVKFVRDALAFHRNSTSRRLCFLTHSSGTVDQVTGICLELDSRGILTGQSKHVITHIRTLYDLAYDYLKFDLDDLTPLSLDGRDGRKMQAELISGILIEMRSDVTLARFRDISDNLQASWAAQKSSDAHQRLVLELMNEFASILDADGIWAGTEKGEKYAKGQIGYRAVWLMSLPTERDRRFVLEIHRRYRSLLTEMNTLSVDQMVADFNSFLDSNTWDRLKSTKGFDAIFVDELHLFTSIERQVLHKLIRNTIGGDGITTRPPIFMAYDVKQSPRDTFTYVGEGDGTLFSASTQLQKSELVKLSKVFRYTPQIAEFLYDLDATFPAIDLAGEWEKFAITAEVADGDIPSLSIFKDEAELLRRVFDTAHDQARRLGGKRVAILCVNDQLFDHYDNISRKRYEGRIIHVNSREPNLDLRHAGKKVIFSMPEYVAGLQFEVVHLLHVDAQDYPKELSIGEQRRVISSIYLGSSRAERGLHLHCCESRGGHASLLNLGIKRGSLTVERLID
ncbi:hypothetical protein S58_50070 [Bradyrhizobium oligotrophicum S58]|uniref:UvrD-like helicase ATP-binding domain-containing protein n=1 Tax=Bradyrhizobium oligotrophicum S58 TaxID=1245469 RepID=M4ZC07_9BRAD|nr:UvrD-helicase domain-containing protein [Bradyrhizobium oligotrophicum]BAM90986.1 hypothetical protein S58_50070 [Bradyrhizobium oligotrophicum S58]